MQEGDEDSDEEDCLAARVGGTIERAPKVARDAPQIQPPAKRAAASTPMHCEDSAGSVRPGSKSATFKTKGQLKQK